ncbi:MAG TPA: response regulator [Polyangia bacterium]|nr:response regulator [Polyangia bacterium]
MPVVLVVDDELDLLAALSDALNDEGWRVLVASSARAALSAARSCTVDVVLCDLLLHGEDGRSVKEAFGRDRGLRRVPFVFMTASLLEAQRLSAERVIEKPFRVHQVVEALAGRLPGEPRAL